MSLIESVTHNDDFLTIDWQDGHQSRHALIWLRDNDPAYFHPDTGERNHDLLTIPERMADAVILSNGRGGCALLV